MLIWRSLSRLCSLHTTCPCQTIISYFCRTSELARQYGSAARFGETFPVFRCTRSHEHQSPKDLDYSLSDVAALANPSTAGWALLLLPGERNTAMNHHDHRVVKYLHKFKASQLLSGRLKYSTEDSTPNLAQLVPLQVSLPGVSLQENILYNHSNKSWQVGFLKVCYKG